MQDEEWRSSILYNLNSYCYLEIRLFTWSTSEDVQRKIRIYKAKNHKDNKTV